MKPSDEDIIRRWNEIVRLWRRGRSLGQKVALVLADKLEADGVTEADIDRLFVVKRAL